MIAIVHSIYSQSVHALALNAGSMDNDAGRYFILASICVYMRNSSKMFTLPVNHTVTWVNYVAVG